MYKEGLVNVTSAVTGSKRHIMCGACSFHWSKGKLYFITAILSVPVDMTFQKKNFSYLLNLKAGDYFMLIPEV